MSNVTTGTIARTIVLILALANQVLAMCGKQVLNIADDDIYQVISLLFTCLLYTSDAADE